MTKTKRDRIDDLGQLFINDYRYGNYEGMVEICKQIIEVAESTPEKQKAIWEEALRETL